MLPRGANSKVHKRMKVNNNKLKSNSSSVYRRRKRKAYESLSISENKMIQIGNKKKKKNNCHSQLAGRALTLAILLQLLCDIMPTPLPPLEVAAQLQQQDSEPASQRFREEPTDMDVLLGQPADINCLIENKSGNLSWFRDNFQVSGEAVRTAFVDRYSLPYANLQLEEARDTTGGSILAQAEPTSYISNYNLHISNVTLRDDANFYCKLTGGQRKSVRSREARITVLKAPTRLMLRAENLTGSPSEPPAKLNIIDFQQRHQQSPASAPESSGGLYQAGQPEAAELSQPQPPNVSSAQMSSPDNSYPSEISSGGAGKLVHMLVVRQNDRIRLECSADAAKPHAELVWLDNLGQPVAKRSPSSSPEGPFVEEAVWADELEPMLRKASLSLHLTVQRNHSNGEFTCEARHRSFELIERQLHPLSNRKHELRTSIKLDVQYEPEIEIVKSHSMPADENESINFHCRAHARPMNNLNYRWFLDNKLISGATEPKLEIERFTRQLHMRQISCEVSNEIGSSLREMRLAVQYGPAYVTHLMPASLQPPLPIEQQSFLDKRRINQNNLVPLPDAQIVMDKAEMPSERKLTLGRQLALGYTPNQELELRCDFDANPRIQEVSWYRITSDFYDFMKEIEPSQADRFIASGLTNAIFRHNRRHEESSLTLAGPIQSSVHRKRHITSKPGSFHQLEEIDLTAEDELDYERMSEKLLQELKHLQEQQQSVNSPPVNGTLEGSKKLEVMNGSQVLPANPQIFEPLDWFVKRTSDQPTSSNAQQEAESLTVLSLTKPSKSSMAKLNRRETQVTSSSWKVKSVREDSMGLYVCRSKSTEPNQASVARSVFLVPRKRPRIVSTREQYASGEHWTGRVQLECLVSIYTVVETIIEWKDKEGRPIQPTSSYEGQLGTGNEHQRNISIEVQYSPDLLFKRSILRISRATKSDFGRYNCVTYNNLVPNERDSVFIELKAMDSRGLIVIMSTAIAAALVLVALCFLGLSTAFSRSRHSAARKVGSQSTKSTSPKMPQKSLDNVDANNSNHNLVKSTANSPQNELEQREGALGQQQMVISNHVDCDNGPLMSQAAMGSLVSSMMFQQQQQMQLQTGNGLYSCENDQSSDHSSQDNSNQILHQGPGNSQLNYGSLAPSTNPNRSSKFIAIQESLESALNFNNVNNNHQPSNYYKTLTNGIGGQPETANHLQSVVSSSSHSGSNELVENRQSSLVNRFMSKMLMRPPSADCTTVARKKLEISSPIAQSEGYPPGGPLQNSHRTNSSASLYKSRNLTGSLSDSNRRSHRTIRHAGNGNYVLSSSANLIQDSTTGSDGTVSGSSRSSSSSGQHKQLNENLHLQSFPEYQFIQTQQPQQQHQNLWPQRKILIVNDMSPYANEAPLSLPPQPLPPQLSTPIYLPADPSQTAIYSNNTLYPLVDQTQPMYF